jgi:CRP/FNR family transcriptional regulator, cyclic AMP receptor protein
MKKARKKRGETSGSGLSREYEKPGVSVVAGVGFRQPVKELLKKTDLFRNLTDAHLEEIASSCRRRSFSKGALILYQTEPSRDLLIVLSGKIKASLVDEEGNEMVLSFFKTGEFLGEMNLFDDKGRSATVTAVDDSETVVLKREDLMSLLLEKPAIAVALIMELAERLRKANELIESLVFLDVRGRVLRELSKMAHSEGKREGNFLKVRKRTHHELAAHIGASREAISKCMKHLLSKEIVREEDGYFLISVQKADLPGEDEKGL